MRLIDADKLNFEDVDFYSPDSTYEVDKVIDDAPTVNAIVIPEGATNGDVIKAVFPSIDFTEMAFTVHATTSVTSNGVKGGISYDFWKDWWNAPYGGEKG